MSSCAGTAEPAEEGPPWSSLPPSGLQLIFDAASRWQVPGPCLAARVCRAWRSAAAGCGGIRLLYVAQAANTSFNAWLGRNSHQLGSLVLSDGMQRTIHDVLGALADAATAAAAAGRPLRLHTLRVLEGGPFMAVTGRLVSVLPNLLCLQLPPIPDSYRTQAFVGQMAPFQQATQLQELYFSGPPQFMDCVQQVVDLLPATLQRLSWAASRGAQCPDLSHLTRLTFLNLRSWPLPRGPLTSKLPPGLQQLELAGDCMSVSHLQEEIETLTGCHGVCDEGDQLQLQSRWTNLRSWSSVPASRLLSPRVGGVLQQLVKLSALGVTTGLPAVDLQPMVSAASSLKGLRRLQLQMRGPSLAPGQLAALTQLTMLHVCGRMCYQIRGQLQVAGAWAAELGRMSRLRWLSVPAALLPADQGWLAGMGQLQVLVLGSGAWSQRDAQQMVSQVQWLSECDLQQLPPHLLLLGLTGMSAQQAAPRQVRGCLQQRLGSRGCELVVGPDLDEVCDPVMQLAGLPVTLQQALA